MNPTDQKIIVHSDGGARGNPGPAAIGVVIDYSGKKENISQTIGHATNNDAEYRAVLVGLEKIVETSVGTTIDWFLDSQLVQRQLIGEYKIKDANLKSLARQILQIIEENNLTVNFVHIERAKNKEADALVNQALDAVVAKSGYTLIEILVASLIFVSVMTIAMAGFLQVSRYRAVISANSSVNQTLQTITEQLNNDIRTADGDPMRMQKQTNNPDLGKLSRVFIVGSLGGNIDEITCTSIITVCIPTTLYKINVIVVLKKISNQNVAKMYYFDTENQASPLGVRYKEVVVIANSGDQKMMINSPTPTALAGNIIVEYSNNNEVKDLVSINNALVQFKAIRFGSLETGNDIPLRIDYDLTVQTPNYGVTGVRPYEQARATLSSSVSVRAFR